jgi:hypothetical protein
MLLTQHKMHPLVTNLDKLKDSELETKINDLTRRYFQTYNPDLQVQISMVLDTYREEMSKRRSAEWQKISDNRNKDLDKLINVS